MHGTAGNDWQAFWAEARATRVEALAARLEVKLKGPKKERFGACPAGCAEENGFRAIAGTNGFFCRPSDTGGGPIELAMHAKKFSDRIEAAEWVLQRARPSGTAKPETPEAAEARETRAAERKANADRRAEEDEAEARAKRKRDREFIDATLARCVPVHGTHADAYLKARGIELQERHAVDLFYSLAVDYWGQASPDATKATKLATLPAMVAKIRNVDGGVIGLHLTYLDPTEPRKWIYPPEEHLPKEERLNPAKKVRGEQKGGLIQLGPIGARVTIGEGIETTLAAVPLFPSADMSYAAALNLGNLAGRSTGTLAHPNKTGKDGKPTRIPNGIPDPAEPGMILPEIVTEQTLLMDGDSEPYATASHMVTAARRARANGLAVFVATPPAGMDFNNVLISGEPVAELETGEAFEARWPIFALTGELQEVQRPEAPPAEPASEGDGFVMVRGVKKRLTTFAELNVRFALLEAPGSASAYVSRADFLPIADMDLKRRLAGEVVYTGIVNEKPAYEAAFNFWTGHAQRHVYRRVAFTNKATSDDTYNLFRGLGVTPREGRCERILAHVREVICSHNANDASAMLKLLAWQIQNIGTPSRIVVILRSEKHQAGKGMLLEELMLKIYGPTGFTPSTTDQVLGRFNDAIRGRAFLFLDEVLFAGDRRAADAIKSLSTATLQGIETKGLPIVQCPVAVNIWLASNHDNAAFIEEHDARYWTLNVSEHRVGDPKYFSDLMHEVDHGGREAFAHFLLNLDVSGFVPSRDTPKDNAAKREMIRRSINPYDARKWLEDCCHAECIIGRKSEGGTDWLPWVEGHELSYQILASAYTEWQKTVKSRVAPEPTQSAALGKVLTSAGFGSRRLTYAMMRTLPDPKKCLSELYDPVKKLAV